MGNFKIKKVLLCDCPCCGALIEYWGALNPLCPVCGWEDDCLETAEPNESGFCNPMPLNKAKKVFRMYGDNIWSHQEQWNGFGFHRANVPDFHKFDDLKRGTACLCVKDDEAEDQGEMSAFLRSLRSRGFKHGNDYVGSYNPFIYINLTSRTYAHGVYRVKSTATVGDSDPISIEEFNEICRILKVGKKYDKDEYPTEKAKVWEEVPKKVLCPVCGKYEFQSELFYDVCEVCGWINNPIQTDNPDLDGDENKMSFNQACENYRKTGKVD